MPAPRRTMLGSLCAEDGYAVFNLQLDALATGPVEHALVPRPNEAVSALHQAARAQ